MNTPKQYDNTISIVVYSCFRNRDMWRYFCVSMLSYWPDRTFKVVLVTDRYEHSDAWTFDDIVQIDSNWSEMITEALRRTQSPFVMLFMDDYLLTDKVRNCDIEQGLLLAKSSDAICVRLLGEDDGHLVGVERGGEEVSYYPLKSAYCLSTHPCIWNSRYLCEFIKEKEWSAWDFERIGSMEYDDSNHPVVIMKQYRFPYIEAVRNGKWLREGIDWCKKNGISIDYGSRKAFGLGGRIVIELKGVLLKVCPNLIVRIQNRLTRRTTR